MSIPRVPMGLALVILASSSLWAAGPDAGAVAGGGLTINDITVTEGNAGTTNAVFTVSLNTPSALVVTVDYTTVDGTATAPADYVATSGTVSFAPGILTASLTVPVVGDTLDESNEGYFVNLSNPVNAAIADGQGVGTINDNDPLPLISITDATVLEGNSGTVPANFTVTLNVPSGRLVTVDFVTSDDSAVAPADYASATGTLSFAPGTTSQSITVQVNGDVLDEANEDFFIDLFNPTNALFSDSQALGNITDDDNAPALSISDVTVTEGNSGTTAATFNVTLSAPSGGQLQVDFATANGTAVAPGDYAAASGTLSFPAGVTIRTVTVNVVGDTLDENNETFNVNLTNPVNVTIADGQGVGTINDDDGPPSVSINDAALSEGLSPNTFTVTLSAPSGLVVSVDFTSADGTATAPADYTATSGTLTFAAGTTTRTIPIAVINDPIDENAETMFVNLTNPVNVTIADSQGIGTIADNDNPPRLFISDVTVTEGNSGTTNAVFNVTLSAQSGLPITVNFATADGSATAPGDYTSSSGTLSFPAGTTIQTVTVPVVGDVIDEANETFNVNLSGPTNAIIMDGLGVGTITDDDTSTLSINDVTVAEGNAGTTNAVFTVSLSTPSASTVNVSFATADGSATAPGDYLSASGTLTFPPGTTAQSVTVAVVGDVLDENDENFLVNLTSPVNATVADAQGVGTITDDDTAAISIGDATVTEGNAGTVNAVFAATLSTPSSFTVTVDFTTADGSATAPADYATASGTLSFAPGQTSATATVLVNGDVIDEADETFFVNLTNPVNAPIADGQGLGTITDDDNAPAISVNDVTVTEGNAGTTNAVFTVSLNVPSGLPVTVNFATADGSATAPGDYTAASGTLSFPRGTTTQTITVAVVGDVLDEANETFLVNLSGATNATILDNQGVGTITDDDNAPSISINDVTVTEGNAGTTNAVFTVSLSAQSGLPISVSFATADGSATAPGDYGAASGTLSFPRGTTTQTITVVVVGDVLDEADETFLVNLSGATNATILDNQGVGTITDDDNAAISIGDATVTEGNAGTVNAVFAATLSTPSSFTVTVDFTTADGSATAPADYATASGTLSFAPGQTSATATVLVNGDVIDEADETFFVNLTNPVNAPIADGQGLGTITDDDNAPAISVNDVTVTEGNAGTTNAVFTVSLNVPSGLPVTVNFATADGSATAPGDYTAASGTLSFPRGTTTQTITVAVVGDVLDEANETFLVNLSGATNATILDNQGVGTITDDDNAPSISINDVTVTEGNAGTTNAVFTVSLSAQSGLPISVSFATADGSATAPGDYGAASGTLSFPRGTTTQTITVVVVGDVLDEANETFLVNLSGATNATILDNQGVGTITDDDNAPSISINDVTVTEGSSGTTNAVFTVSLSAQSGLPISVAFATADGTATAPGDYTAASGTLSFPRGTTTQTITVAVVGDVLDEANETFLVNLSSATNATIADNQGVGTITDDDNPPSLSVNDVTVTEGNAGTTNAVFTVSLSAPSALPISVAFATADGTATAPGDYTAASGTLSFPRGTTTQTITVAVVGDVLDEANETFLVNLSSATNATILDNQGVGTITDDDNAPSISINDVTVTEGSSGTTNAVFTVSLSAQSGLPISVAFATADGTATAPGDYTAASGTLSFPRGTTTQTITVAVVGDVLDEADETFLVNLSGATNATIADNQGVGTITDDDNAPSLSVNDVTVIEGNAGTVNAVFTVSLDAASGLPISVDFATADGTATAPADYTATSGTLSFPRGTTTATVTVNVVGDTLPEAVEGFFVNLTNATNAAIADAQGAGTITDDDTPPSISITDVTVAEGDTGTVDAVFTVSLSGPSGLPVTVDFASADGTATAPGDYAPASGTLSFPRGTTSQTVTVAVAGDVLDESDETFLVNLTNATNATIADGQGVGTITDDDGAPTLSVTDVTVTEGDAGTTSAVFTVSLSVPSGQSVTVDFSTSDGTATAPGDYTAASGTLSFPRGTTTQTVTVDVVGDTLDEADETFNLDLTNATNATIADAQGVGTVTDDDGPPAISIDDVSVVEGNAGTQSAVFTVSLSAPSGQTVSVDFATSDGTANAPGDYTSATGTVSFAAGETAQNVSVDVVGDTLDEADETFNVDLTNPTNATIADPQGACTITDDDGAATRIELVHGSALLADLQAQGGSPDSDVYAISQRPGSSYEAVVDATGGDVVPIQLERVDSAGGVLQTAVPIGAGSSLSLRWATSSGTVVNDESIRVRSGNCTSSCGPEDGYRIRLHETTASIARFNNSSTQVTVLVLQNTGEAPVSGTVRFWDTAGNPAGQQAFSLSAKQAVALNTAAVAPGVGGSITIAHDGEYGQLTGKAVAVETATGFTFDTSLGYRPR